MFKNGKRFRSNRSSSGLVLFGRFGCICMLSDPQTKKLTSMFRLKDNNIHPSHVVYHGTCADCSASYIGESCRNFETRKQEHEDATKQSEPARHLRENPYHHFNWRVIAIAHPLGIRRILESMFIAKFQPCLKQHLNQDKNVSFPVLIIKK